MMSSVAQGTVRFVWSAAVFGLLFAAACRLTGSSAKPSNSDLTFLPFLNGLHPLESHGDISRLRTDKFVLHKPSLQVFADLKKAGFHQMFAGTMSSFRPVKMPSGYTYINVVAGMNFTSEDRAKRSQETFVTVMRSTSQQKSQGTPITPLSRADDDRVHRILDSIEKAHKLTDSDRDFLFTIAKSDNMVGSALAQLDLIAAVKQGLCPHDKVASLLEDAAKRGEAGSSLEAIQYGDLEDFGSASDDSLEKESQSVSQEYYPPNGLCEQEKSLVDRELAAQRTADRVLAARIMVAKKGLGADAVKWLTSRIDQQIQLFEGKEKEYWQFVKRVVVYRNPS